MADRVRKLEAGALDLPLVLCCAEDDEVALARVIDELHRGGVAPEIVLGIEQDAEVLARAVDRTRGPALFVLCTSPNLDRAHVRRLTGLFSARRGEDQRLTQVQLAPGRPLAILPAIREAMKNLRDDLEQGPIEEDNVALLRDVVGPTSVSALPKRAEPAISDAEQMAIALKRELEEAEAMLDRRRRRPPEPKPKPASPPPPPAAARSERPVAPPPIAVSRETRDDSSTEIASPRPSSPAPVVPVSVPPGAITQTDEIVVPAQAASAAKSPRSPVIPIVLGVGAIAALAAIALHALDRGDTDGARTPAPSTAATPAMAKAEVPIERERAPEPEPVAAPAPAEPAPAEPSAADLPPPPPPTVDDQTPLDRALADGKLHAVGTLLVLPPKPDTMTWIDATETCTRRRIAKLYNFRLPTRAEIAKLAAAGVLDDGTFWTRDRVSDDEAYAYDRAAARSHVWLTVEPNARAICVRKRP